MKILLIAPSSGNWRNVGRHHLFNGKTFRFSMLSLLSVAAETPPGVEVRIVDEQIEEIPWNHPWDLAGITCMTAVAPRAYEIADRFRQAGVPVALGGMHPSFCPDEALDHADAVVVGEAEGVWARVVADAATGCLRGIYRSEKPVDLTALKRLPRELLNGRNYATIHAVQATRGCPHRCDFCSVSAFNRHTQRRRRPSDVVDEIAGIPDRFFMLVDDNLTADRDFARELFLRLRPLRKRWITQCTLSLAEDAELLDLAAQAGCIGIFAGLETFSKGNLDSVSKDFNRVGKYREWIRRFHERGIAVEAGIVLGLPGDRPRVFAKTLHMLNELEIDLVQVSIFTPLPGTRRFDLMQDRILDRDWAHYDFHHVVFEPWAMSSESLQAGHDWVTNRFYQPWQVAKRLLRHALRPNGWRGLFYLAAVSLAYYGRVLRWHIHGWNPAQEQKAPRPAWAPAQSSLPLPA